MTTNFQELSNAELDREARRVALLERHTTVELIKLLMEVEERRLYLVLGYSSLFAYCTTALWLSAQAAYSRITVARAARRFPQLLELLEDGALTLSSIGLLAPHLTEHTVDALIDGARFRTTRDVERMLAGAFPQPDVPTLIRALPDSPAQSTEPAVTLPGAAGERADVDPTPASTNRQMEPSATPALPRPVVAPISATRFLLKVTLSEDTEHKLQRARALMRHAIPDGDLDEILNRALTLFLDRVARTKLGQARRPGTSEPGVSATGRHVPAAVKRRVWKRDGGRCVFVGADGICGETAFLEFHHVIPFASGGRTTVDNLQLRCRAHNAYEAGVAFGVMAGTH